MLIVRGEGRGKLVDGLCLDRNAPAKCLLGIDFLIYRTRKNREIVVRVGRILIDVATIVAIKHHGAKGHISWNDRLVDEPVHLLVEASMLCIGSGHLS